VEKREIHTLWLKYTNVRDNLGELGLHGRIILKWILKSRACRDVLDSSAPR
jgi:hypothetical protein